MRVAFLGLGVMGYHMAGHLSRQGHDVRVYNRTRSKAETWLGEFDGSGHSSPKDACSGGVEAALLCVGDDPDVKEVLLGNDGALEGLPVDSVIVDHTTTSAKLAKEFADICSARSIGYVDAPVSGGEAGAKAGRLTVMCGGEAEHFKKVAPAVESYAAFVRLIGGSGSGQLAKMVNQICIAGIIQGLSEGLHFGKKVGLNMNDVVDAISGGAAQSWQLDNRAKTMLDGQFDFGFAVDWMLKDLRICLDQARDSDIDLPLTEIVRGYYEEISEKGGGRWDTSSLINRLDGVRS